MIKNPVKPKLFKTTSPAIILSVVVLSFIIIVMLKNCSYYHSKPYIQIKDQQSNILVVYYSRSGFTETMAREIARYFNADILKLESNSYALGFFGWAGAMSDAYFENYSEIAPQKINTSKYNTIFLGAPIWLYSPATPLWAFIDKNDFKNNSVYLFTTFNSNFEEKKIKAFGEKIEKRGGRFLEHLYMKRGSSFNQISPEELIKRTMALLNKLGNKTSSPK
jgi:flavodoxin